MGDITRNFSRKEFACKCGCGSDNISYNLVQMLQLIRDHFGTSIKIVSGLRCPKRNRKVGGAKSSQHLLGRAADIQVSGVSPKKVASFASSLMMGWGGVKAYSSFTHVDVRSSYWRG